jgi:hypothetical protein
VWQRAGVVGGLVQKPTLQLVPPCSLQQVGLSLAAELEPQVAIDVKAHLCITSFSKRKVGSGIRHAAASPSGIRYYEMQHRRRAYRGNDVSAM